MMNACMALLICSGLSSFVQERSEQTTSAAAMSPPGFESEPGAVELATSHAQELVGRSRNRASIKPHLERFESAYRRYADFYKKEHGKDSFEKGRVHILEGINWSERYRQIELMSDEETLEELERLWVDAPAELYEWGPSHTYSAARCMDALSETTRIYGNVVWFRTSKLNIYVNGQWGGASGYSWAICDRKTDRLVRAPTSESNCSAGSVYRSVRFKEYVQAQTPFLEAHEGGCRGYDPLYEAIYDLELRAEDVKGSVNSFVNRNMAWVTGNAKLYTWHVPRFRGYNSFESESWSSRGERRWVRREVVQMHSREDGEEDRVCEGEDRTKYKCTKQGRVPDPTWERRCRFQKSTREIICERVLVERAPAEPFFSDTSFAESSGLDYDEALFAIYERRLDRLDELRALGYDIPDKSINEMRANRKRLLEEMSKKKKNP